MYKQCPECGKELNADANFCQACGADTDGKVKNDFLSGSNKKYQSRFLTVLTIALILLVLGFYLFRSFAPANEFEGEWIGTVTLSSGVVYQYSLNLEYNNDEIRGTAITATMDGSGSADALIIGSYSDGKLNFQEYGGGESGEWTDHSMCFWEIDLELVQIEGEDHLEGTFEAIDCNSSGTISLARAQ